MHQRHRCRTEQPHCLFHAGPGSYATPIDDGRPANVAHATNGQWISLFRPEHGVLHAGKLVNMAKHNYHLEPNVHFTPDGKWIVFRSNMFGPSYVFEVQIAKAKG